MPGRITHESILLSAGALTVLFRADSPIRAVDLIDAAGTSVATAPALKIGGDLSGVFDLRRLPVGIYSIGVRIGGEFEAFGRDVASGVKLSAHTTSSATAGLAKFAGSTFSVGPAKVFAWLYADLRTFALRLRISATDDIDAFLSAEARRTVPQSVRFSVVTAAYNVAKYLDEYFESLVRQSLDFRSHIELILVDDGSTDRTAKVIKRWQRKFPGNIVYLRQDNRGPGAARNAGLARARYDWITFIDADDYVGTDYFECIDRALHEAEEASIAMVVGNTLFFDEADRRVRNGYPPSFRTESARVRVGDMRREIQPTVNSAFFRRGLVERYRIQFDERLRPAFEDTLFAGQYLHHVPQMFAIHLRSPEYFRRRRADASSLQDNASQHPGTYTVEPRRGYLRLLQEAGEVGGNALALAQNTVLYAVVGSFWRLKKRVISPVLTPDQAETYIRLLREVFSHIDENAIVDYDVTYLSLADRAGLLNLLKQQPWPVPIVEATDFDAVKKMVRLVYYSQGPTPTDVILVDGSEVAPAYSKARRHDFLGRVLIWEHIRWVRLSGGHRLAIKLDNRAATLSICGQQTGQEVPIAAIGARLTKPLSVPLNLPAAATVIRDSLSAPAAAEYRDAWLFMDRPHQADDSAEHLFAYVREQHPEINAYFVLDRKSREWNRLATAAGHRLLPFGGPQHTLAHLSARFLISSQIEEMATWHYSSAPILRRPRQSPPCLLAARRDAGRLFQTPRSDPN